MHLRVQELHKNVHGIQVYTAIRTQYLYMIIHFHTRIDAYENDQFSFNNYQCIEFQLNSSRHTVFICNKNFFRDSDILRILFVTQQKSLTTKQWKLEDFVVAH